ncbi:hypothetical protein PAERUG_P40_Scotland_4_VIM_2_09_12_04013 [Pseudomonas aeruginosa]|nr:MULTISPECIES: hypothetical protein [Pseudomonas]CRN64607.1 hypothetical protein PAERUG_P40_Scotland_4_VIM_2_09_12_04013 [Pseudomonas aeruginosa]
MDWKNELQMKLAGWESATDYSVRREYCLSVLRNAGGLNLKEIFDKVIVGAPPVYALQSDDFGIYFELVSRLLRSEDSEGLKYFFGADIKSSITQEILTLVACSSVEKLEAFIAAAKLYSIPKEYLPVAFVSKMLITPAVVGFFENHRDDFTFDIYPDYFEGLCWTYLGWPDYLRSLKLPDRSEVERAIAAVGRTSHSKDVPSEWDLSSLTVLIVTGKLDDIVSEAYRNLAVAKWLSHTVITDNITQFNRTWLMDMGSEGIAKLFASAMEAAHEYDREQLSRGLMGVMMILGGAAYSVQRISVSRRNIPSSLPSTEHLRRVPVRIPVSDDSKAVVP